jgi:putative redox protein
LASSKFTFPGHDGSALAARLELPDDAPRAFALFAHCFTCGKDSLAAARISRALTARGIAVLRFDFTGLGASEGEFANTNFSSNVADLVCAADHLRREHDAPALLVGHSLGGTAVLAAARDIPEAVAVATIAAPAEPAHVAGQFGAAEEALETQDEVEVELAGRPFRIQRQFLDDVRGSRVDDCIAQLGRALLVMHSPRDTIVGIDSASRIFQQAKHPKSFVSLDQADHLLTRREDADYVAAVLAAWAGRYLESAEDAPAPGAEDDGLAAGVVEVVEAGSGKFTQRIRSGRHQWLADEPRDFGGDDAGPTPYDLLLAGLGACTTMTLRMYATRKKLPLDRVGVTLRHERIHAEDCSDCETKEGKLDEIRRSITLQGDLDDAQRQRLLEIADRCPVHRTLTGEVRIRTALAGAGKASRGDD